MLPSITGLYMVPGTDFYPALCFCRNMQTATYEIVNGSYVPTAETKQNKIKVLRVVIVSYEHLITIEPGELCPPSPAPLYVV